MASIAVTGVVVGTPAFVAPELASGYAANLDATQPYIATSNALVRIAAHAPDDTTSVLALR